MNAWLPSSASSNLPSHPIIPPTRHPAPILAAPERSPPAHARNLTSISSAAALLHACLLASQPARRPPPPDPHHSSSPKARHAGLLRTPRSLTVLPPRARNHTHIHIITRSPSTHHPLTIHSPPGHHPVSPTAASPWPQIVIARPLTGPTHYLVPAARPITAPGPARQTPSHASTTLASSVWRPRVA